MKGGNGKDGGRREEEEKKGGKEGKENPLFVDKKDDQQGRLFSFVSKFVLNNCSRREIFPTSQITSPHSSSLI